MLMFHFSLFLPILISSVSGSVILFNASPDDVIEALTEETTLRCSLNDTSASAAVVGRRDVTRTPDNVEQVSTIIIMHEGSDVASVSISHPAKLLVSDTNLKVVGSLTRQPGEKGFLQLTISHPTSSQGGGYSCDVSAVTPAGHTKIFTATTKLTMTTPTIFDLVKEINKCKVITSKLEESLSSTQHTHVDILEAKINSQDAKLKTQDTKIAALETKINSQASKIAAQETNISSQAAKIAAQEASISTLQSQITNQTKQFNDLTLTELVTKRHQQITGHASTCTSGLESVRLVGGDGSYGAVEMTYNGRKGFVCDDDWDEDDAHVVCRMLGYFPAISVADGNDFYNGTNIVYHANYFECDGTEMDLTDCYHLPKLPWTWENCDDSKIAGVRCRTVPYNRGHSRHSSVDVVDQYICTP